MEYVDTNSEILNLYTSEDISVGSWFGSMRNVFRKHDCRFKFDIAYMARTCKDFHIVLHKRNAEDVRSIFKGSECNNELSVANMKRPLEYFYNWKAAPMPML